MDVCLGAWEKATLGGTQRGTVMSPSGTSCAVSAVGTWEGLRLLVSRLKTEPADDREDRDVALAVSVACFPFP